MSVGAGETVGTQRFANYGAAWLPVLPLLLLVVAILARVNVGMVVLLLLASLVALGIVLLVALSPGVVIECERLWVPGREARRRRPGGEVDLAGLTRVRSVSYQGGWGSRGTRERRSAHSGGSSSWSPARSSPDTYEGPRSASSKGLRHVVGVSGRR